MLLPSDRPHDMPCSASPAHKAIGTRIQAGNISALQMAGVGVCDHGHDRVMACTCPHCSALRRGRLYIHLDNVNPGPLTRVPDNLAQAPLSGMPCRDLSRSAAAEVAASCRSVPSLHAGVRFSSSSSSSVTELRCFRLPSGRARQDGSRGLVACGLDALCALGG